ncbi:hypothetical protein [Streptomyces caeruleatus]|uniref:Uncharacterized protein n=1 Tax=Streptomyces caeruleatus TaxID=661399 RepID=A0A117RR24_9ACTN|nr:hypothetical protein [Streptomyces caeruleatus]KUO04577.1 hypothetical protein AQJ67_10210 [Streptomyces caeruleatus]
MALYAREFFMEHLKLPFTEATVVGNTYLAAPIPGGPLRLRIAFSRAFVADTYGGLRLAAIHQDRGELDAVALRFEDHKTFDHRDATLGRRPGQSGYSTIYEHRDRPDLVPWKGAHTIGLRDAIEQYTAVWFPGAWTVSAPSRDRGRTAHTAPAVPVARSGTRAR